jgi:hypothetical protein
MQRFIKVVAYGIAAAAISVMTVNVADAQRGGRGGSNGGGSNSGGARGGMSGGSRGGSTMQHKFNDPRVTTTKHNLGQGGFKHQANKTPMNKQPFHNVAKNTQHGKGFAKGEPNPSAPGGFKHPGQFNNHWKGSPFKGKFNDFCGTPWGGKYHCNNWNWKGNSHCGWNYGCYPYQTGCFYPKSCWYPTYNCGYYPTCYSTYCFNTCYYTPLCTQTVYVPTVVEVPVPVVAPVTAVTQTTTVAKSTTQQLVQPPLEALGGADLSFVTGSVVNQ